MDSTDGVVRAEPGSVAPGVPPSSAPAPAPAVADLAALRPATGRLVRTVDGIDDADWTSPSLLPEWSRAHVVAHLALNAEGLGAAVRGVLEGRRTPMYPSPEQRDDDIELLATASPSVLRDRLLGAATELAQALGVLATTPEAHDVLIERTPGSDRTFTAGSVPGRRLREVEIHHADLGLGYAYAAWPRDFAEGLLERLPADAPEPAHLEAVDAGRRWRLGAPHDAHPTVRGPLRALAWWATGRTPAPGDLTSDSGTLPRMEAM